AAAIDVAIDGVEILEQTLTIFESIEWRLERQVIATFAGDIERRIRSAEPGRPIAEDAVEANVGWQSGRSSHPALASKDRAHARLVLPAAVVGRDEVVAGHDEVRAAAVAGVAVRERMEERKLIGAGGDLLERAADLDAGELRFHGASDRAILGRSAHLGVKSLNVRRSVAEPEPDDGSVPCRQPSAARRFTRAKQTGQAQAAQSERANLQEITAI